MFKLVSGNSQRVTLQVLHREGDQSVMYPSCLESNTANMCACLGEKASGPSKATRNVLWKMEQWPAKGISASSYLHQANACCYPLKIFPWISTIENTAEATAKRVWAAESWQCFPVPQVVLQGGGLHSTEHLALHR